MTKSRGIRAPRAKDVSEIKKSYHYKADSDLVKFLDELENRNRFINAAVRAAIEKLKEKQAGD